MDVDALIRGDLEQFRRSLAKHEQYEGEEYDLKKARTAVHIACTHGHLNIVKYLINSGCDANYCRDTDGCAALHLASKNGYASIVRFLLGSSRYGINISASNGNGDTPLHLACFQGHAKVVRELVNSQLCDLNASNLEGNTPIHIACISGAFECAKLLVNLNREDCVADHPNQKTGDTPLHTAAHHGHIGIVQCILHSSKTSNILVPNHSGKTALDIAISKNHSEISCLFLDEVRNDETLFQQLRACDAYSTLLHNCKPLLQSSVTLMDSDCEVNAPNQGGITPLHTACLHGHTEELKWLIQSKHYNLNIPNKSGDTPLHIACCAGEAGCVQLLVSEPECDLNHRNKYGDTPLHIACLQGAFECAQILFNNQDININEYQNNEQWTLPHTAVVGGHFDSQWHQLFAFDSWNLSTKSQRGETLLHVACCYGHLKVVKYIFGQLGSSALLQCQNSGDTPLHVACQANHIEIVRYIVNECANISMNINARGETALVTSVKRKHWECVQVIAESDHYNLNKPDSKGNTFLHQAVESNDIEGVNTLLSIPLCDTTARNMRGETPLSIALKRHNFSVALAILTSSDHYSINSPDGDGNTILHHAVIANDAELIARILESDSCDPNLVNKAGETPLHICCRQITSTDAICEMLLEDQRCNPNVTDGNGNTALHTATKGFRTSHIKLLIDRKCDVSIRTMDGDTPLHIACAKGSKRRNTGKAIVKLLLYTGKIDPECVNNAGVTPIELAGTNYSIIQEITHFIESKAKHPVETYVKLLVLGNASTGKSTLIKAICAEASKLFKFAPAKFRHVQGVQQRTAGIIPIPFRSKNFGNAVLYDFAGQHEYYSSHAAVLENLVLPTPPAIVVVVDMSEPLDQVLEKLTYWWSFIDNHSQRTSTPPHVILAASHSDIVKARGEKAKEVMKEILKTIDVLPATFNFIGHAYLDCRKLVSHGLTNVLLMLNKTCSVLRSNANVDFRCHLLTAFLSERFRDKVACTVSKLISKVQDEDSLLPQDATEMVQLLSTLNDKGQVMLLNNFASIKDCWVVLQREVLLKEMNGSIFSPETFKQHYKDFARSTGVVPLSKIKERFPQYHPDMITGFLSHLEFCFKIEDYYALEMITDDWNPRSHTAIEQEKEVFYFFPALVRVENPPLREVWNPDPKMTFQCGWFYQCTFNYQFLTTRCLHVLILRIAFSFALGIDHRPLDQIPVIRRRCSAWKHGIAWRNMDGIETVVEAGLQHQWIVVMMRCSSGQEVACAQLRSSVIKTVLDTKAEFCPALNMSDYLISPSALQYPLMSGQELTLYGMKDVATAVVTAKPFVLDDSGTKPAEITNLLPFEPYTGFGETLLRKLFDTEYSNKEVSNKELSDIAERAYKQLDLFEQALKPMQSRFQERYNRAMNITDIVKCIYLFEIVRERGSGTFRELERELSRFSIFCGQNPLES